MAEYYPLLAKAVGSLPNSTPETRRVVYERARKALIGQLRTLHPPVPEDDIERESVELDRAIQRLERELASGGIPTPAGAAPPVVKSSPAPIASRPPRPASVLPDAGDAANRKPSIPVRTKMPKPKPAIAAGAPVQQTAELTGTLAGASVSPPVDSETGLAILPPAVSGVVAPPERAAVAAPPEPTATTPGLPTVGMATSGITAGSDPLVRPRVDMQRPIAPQPPGSGSARRRVWIIPAGIGIVVLVVAAAAYKLRDTRQSTMRAKPTEQVAQSESGKISERVGNPNSDSATRSADVASKAPSRSADTGEAAVPAASSQTPANPEVPVAHRAALLIEAPDEPNKVKTFLGSVVWKLNNVNEVPGDAVGLAVEADVDLPDDKMKAVLTFEKNTDASLPASHTIKIRFNPQPGSPTGSIKQISVPQLRQEDSPSGEALAGVTVSVVPNSFLVGLSPGNAETVNIKQLKDNQWIDVPILLDSGKIAKLTFEKGTSGERDLNEAIASWQKS